MFLPLNLKSALLYDFHCYISIENFIKLLSNWTMEFRITSPMVIHSLLQINCFLSLVRWECVYVCMYTYMQVPIEKPEVGVESSEAEVTDGCELLNMDAWNWTSIFWKKSVYCKLPNHLYHQPRGMTIKNAEDIPGENLTRLWTCKIPPPPHSHWS